MRKLSAFLVFFVSLILSFFISSTIIFAEGIPTSPVTEPEKILEAQKLGEVWANPVKYAIRGAISAGVPANTIILLLLLPIIAFIIAASRHLIGLRGFGIFLPAALSVVFVATGPIVGIGLFLGIVLLSVATRFGLNRLRLRLQYLPRMAFILWVVAVGVLGILFAAPIIKRPEITSVSIFPVLILVLLTEDFTRVQIGKSIRIALNLTIETLILALISYFFLTLKPLQNYALLNPEITLITVAISDVFLGRFIGLRLLEYYRFRKLINQ